MSERLTKSLRFQIKDATQGLVEAVFSTFNVKDSDDDWTLPGAFQDGTPVVISAYGHKSWMGVLPVGKGAIRAEADRAVLAGQFFLGSDAGKETFEVVKAMGEMQEWSYGYNVLETGELTEELRQKGVTRVLQKLEVYEVSPVLKGAGVGTMTISAKGKGEKPEPTPEEIAADEELKAKARQEFVRFQKTRSRLVVLGR